MQTLQSARQINSALRKRPRLRLSAPLMALLAIAALGSAARAEDASEEPLITMMEAARDQITKGTYDDGRHVAPETEAERAEELLNPADGQRVVYAGYVSGMLKWCGLDWTLSHGAFFSAERGKLAWSAKQLAYMGVLHDVAMESYLEQVKPTGECSDEAREDAKEAVESGRFGW